MRTNITKSPLLDPSEVERAKDAAHRKFVNEALTPRTSTSEQPAMDLYWKQRGVSSPVIGLSSSSLEGSTLPLISESCSWPTIGRPQQSGSGTQTGQDDVVLYATSEKQSLPPGVIGTPYGNLQFYGENPKNPILPTDPKARKKVPLWSGLVKYFPDALAAVAAVSYQGNEQHNPGKPLHWDRSKSMDQQDTLLRHLWESGTADVDGHLHSAKVAWRALAMLQLELENNAN